jgi:predicted esterase
MESGKIDISVDIPMTYHRINVGDSKPLIIFFHGFADSAEALLKRAYPNVSEIYEILAINGPFPVPQKKAEEWKPAFAWYFFDVKHEKAFISPTGAVNGVQSLLKKLNLENRKKFLVGFSQGAFFVSHLLHVLSEVQHVVCIGAACRAEDYPALLNFNVDAIHGKEDLVITIERAQQSFNQLKSKNPKGEFIKFEGLGHSMNDESRQWLANKIDQVFQK